jgi:hypothetical protein
MRLRRPLFLALSGALAVLAPIAARSANAPLASPISVVATRAVGAEAVTLTGTAPPSLPLEATLYVTFSQDLPTVLLSRNTLRTDANGRFTATLAIAPAYFRNAIVTAVVQSLPAGPSARASILVGAPNAPAPPDAVPPSDR